MANPRSPNDPYSPDHADEPYRSAARHDTELQVDPELAEGPASGGRIAIFGLAIIVVLGAVFYGLNSSEVGPSGAVKTEDRTAAVSPPTAPNAAEVNQPAKPAASPSAQAPAPPPAAGQSAQAPPPPPPANQSTAQNGAQRPAGVRDVTPHNNQEPGTTTGSAPAKAAQPIQPPSSAPTGTQVDRAATPTTGNTTTK